VAFDEIVKTAETLNSHGVVKVEGFFGNDELRPCRLEYERALSTYKTKEIYRDQPLVVLWTHVLGADKVTCPLSALTEMSRVIKHRLVPYLADLIQLSYPHITVPRLQLLEVIVFNKPPQISNTLNWHQDVAYFPLEPNNQIAVWFPLSVVTTEIGPMVYAHGSHKLGIRGSTNLHTREIFQGETRALIPSDPQELGLSVVEYPMTVEDLLIHNGLTWHYSKPNISKDKPRMGVSVRFIIEEARFDPRPGQGAAFTQQIDVKPGEVVRGAAFPVLWEKS
jgi:hypothetical protein